MDPRMTCLENLDLELSIAYLTLAAAREVFARSPVAENQRRIDAAEAEVNMLLDRRLAVRR